jgi:hypothetical protein
VKEGERGRGEGAGEGGTHDLIIRWFDVCVCLIVGRGEDSGAFPPAAHPPDTPSWP